MSDKNMLFERIVLSAWGKTWRREDPFQLGDADTLGGVNNDLSGDNGHDVRFALSSALKKIAAENSNKQEIHDSLIDLDKRVWSAKVYNDICVIMEETKILFNSLGMNIY